MRCGKIIRLCFAMPLLCALSACVNSASQSGQALGMDATGSVKPAAHTVPKNATIALLSVRGSDQQLGAQFQKQFDASAKTADIALTDAHKARFLLRGYVTEFADSDGTNLSVVLDIYDAKRARSQRISHDWTLAGKPGSVSVDDAALQVAVNDTMSDLSNFLAQTDDFGSDKTPVMDVSDDKGDRPQINKAAAFAASSTSTHKTPSHTATADKTMPTASVQNSVQAPAPSFSSSSQAAPPLLRPGGFVDPIFGALRN